MKLVDILARELEPYQWPAIATHAYSSGTLARFAADDGKSLTLYVEISSEPDDYATAFVTRAEWQAAVDALKAAENAVPEWSGEDLPPVGTVCEHKDLIPGEEWTEVEIVAHRTFDGDDYPCAVFVYSQGSSNSSSGDHFRPIRTPEQIAAEERRAAILEIVKVLQQEFCAGDDDGSLSAEAIYQAGYRKQVKP